MAANSVAVPNVLEQAHHLNDSSPLIVNPTMAEDVDVLERHPMAQNNGSNTSSRPYIRVSNTRGESIVYRNVPRQREGLQKLSKSGVAQNEVMGHVLGNLRPHVLKLYFDKIHPNFPILDETSFWSAFERQPQSISSTLLCDMYAVTLPYWACSRSLRDRPCPDKQFAWNQAVVALRDDFLSPSMTTIQAALLDLLGRPVYSTTGNIVTIGRTVTFAHSLGLHRDPSTWRITEEEKSSRVRIWWAVLIHDHWSSLAHGTPPSVHSQYHDVELSLVESYERDSDPTAQPAVASFYRLCWLTKILGSMLPLIYSLRSNPMESWKIVRRIECGLDEWEDSLSDDRGDFDVNGTLRTRQSENAALWFYFLSMKLTLQRLAFKTAINHHCETQEETKAYRFAKLRSAGFDIVDFLGTLTPEHYAEFWLPYTSYLVVSATTTLLRCAVESATPAEQQTCSRRLSALLKTLRFAYREANWELAELCIETCAHSIESLAAINQSNNRSVSSAAQHAASASSTAEARQPTVHLAEEPNATQNDDQFFPLDLDIPWDHLWDDIGEPWQLLG